jgi:hypothetical protein
VIASAWIFSHRMADRSVHYRMIIRIIDRDRDLLKAEKDKKYSEIHLPNRLDGKNLSICINRKLQELMITSYGRLLTVRIIDLNSFTWPAFTPFRR